VSIPAELRRIASPRLPAVAAIAIIGLFGGLLAGQPALVAVAAPFAVMLAAGLVLPETPKVTLTLEVEADRVLEGQEVRGRLRVLVDPPAGAVSIELDHRGSALVVEEHPGDALRWTGPARLPAVRAIRLLPTRWGLERFGPARVEVTGPFGLVRWEGVAPSRPS